MDRKEIKAKAKKFGFENKKNIWMPFLILAAITFVISFIAGMSLFAIEDEAVTEGISSMVTTLLEIALIPASVGCTYYLIKLVNGKKVNLKEDLLCKYKNFVVIYAVTALVSLYTSLWSLLLIVPGIIYAFKMAMVGYILAEDDGKLTIKEVMNRSKEMMDGYKMNYFVFNLSFIGWYFLTGITLGIASIWVVPYITTANVMYYEELKKVKKIK